MAQHQGFFSTESLSQRITGVSSTDDTNNTMMTTGETSSSGASGASLMMDGCATNPMTTKADADTPPGRKPRWMPRPHSHNYSGPTPRTVKACLVALVVTLLALITTASTSGKIEALRASLASGFFDEDYEGGEAVVLDGSAPRRDCGVTQEAWNKAVGLDRRDPCREVRVRGRGDATGAYKTARSRRSLSSSSSSSAAAAAASEDDNGDGDDWALVTGGAGFIGSAVTRQLLDAGLRVRVLDDLSTGAESRLKFAQEAQTEGRFEFVKGDVKKYEDVSAAVKEVSYVFHLAAVSKVKPTLDSSKDDIVYACVETNVKGTENVLRAVRLRDTELQREGKNYRVRVVYAGSSTYYGNQPTPFDEEHTHLRTTTTPYATTKAQGEDLARLYYAMYGVEAVVVRLFMVYGENEPDEGDQAVVTGRFFASALAGQPLEVEGDGTQFRDFVYVEDAARGMLLAAFTSTAVGRTFNIGSGTSTTVGELADMISSSQQNVAMREKDLKGTLASTCLAKRVLGFEAQKSLDEYIMEVKRSKGLR